MPAAEFAGVEVDDPVAPSPAASIGDATISSVGHRPSSIVASNRDQQFRSNSSWREPVALLGRCWGLAPSSASRARSWLKN